MNIEIMQAFARLREFLASHAELADRLDQLETRVDGQSAWSSSRCGTG